MIRHIAFFFIYGLGMVAGCSTLVILIWITVQKIRRNLIARALICSMIQERLIRLVRGNMDFAFNIFRQFNREDRDNNIFISP